METTKPASYVVVVIQEQVDVRVQPLVALLAIRQPRNALVPAVIANEHLQRADVVAVHVTHETQTRRTADVTAGWVDVEAKQCQCQRQHS